MIVRSGISVPAQLPSPMRPGLAAPDAAKLSEAALGVGYYRNASGGEVDFAPIAVTAPSGSRMTTPIESKWVTRGWRHAS